MSDETPSVFGRVVDVVQYITLGACVLMIVALFAYSKDGEPPPSVYGADDGAEVADVGRITFAEIGCSGCHGPTGEGGIGPSLVGVQDRFTVDEETALVLNGKGRMPAFGDRLDAEQIAEVVEYTRTLGSGG